MAYASPFSAYVDVESARPRTNPGSEEVSYHDRILKQAANEGLKHLKSTVRSLNLSPTHPARKSLWPLLISARFGVKISSEPQSVEGAAGDESLPAGSELLSDASLLPTFHLNGDGQHRLRHALHTISATHPELVYVPQLFPLLALFLHYHDEEVAVACAKTLLERGGNQFLVQTRAEWKEQCLALELLGRSRLTVKRSRPPWIGRTQIASRRSSAVASISNSMDARLALSHWTTALWHMPFEHVVRMVDCLLLEGQKVLYRAGLILWKTTVKFQGRTEGESSTQLFDLDKFASKMPISVQSFIQRMFDILNFSKSDLMKALASIRQSEDFASEELDRLLIHSCAGSTKQALRPTYLDNANQIDATHLHPSACVTVSELARLIGSIRDDRLVQLSKPILLFSTNRDGTSLKTFYARAAVSPSKATILLVRSQMGQHVIGAFCTDQWRIPPQSGYFGSGLSFVFGVRPEPITIYAWTGLDKGIDPPSTAAPENFQNATTEGLHVGGAAAGGSSAPAISLDNRLSTCCSGPSPTFGNPCLLPTDSGDVLERFGDGCSFSAGLVELIGFAEL